MCRGKLQWLKLKRKGLSKWKAKAKWRAEASRPPCAVGWGLFLPLKLAHHRLSFLPPENFTRCLLPCGLAAGLHHGLETSVLSCCAHQKLILFFFFFSFLLLLPVSLREAPGTRKVLRSADHEMTMIADFFLNPHIMGAVELFCNLVRPLGGAWSASYLAHPLGDLVGSCMHRVSLGTWLVKMWPGCSLSSVVSGAATNPDIIATMLCHHNPLYALLWLLT